MANGDSGGGSARVLADPGPANSGSADRPPPGFRLAAFRPTGLDGRYARVIIAAVLLLVVMAGVRVSAPAVAGHGPLRRDALGLGIAAEVVLAVLETVLVVRSRRAPDAGHQAMVLRKILQWITAILMAGILIIAVADLVGTRQRSKILRALTGTGKPPKHPKVPKVHRFTVAPFPIGDLVYSLLALVVLAAIVICVLLVMRRRPGLDPGFLEDADVEEVEELRQAVESGRVALHAVDDARAAIIACYVAMEGSLAQVGTARTVAETPDELLGRATASGLLRGPAAGRLTVLFYEARYSTHGLPGTVKDDAREALDAISAELAGRAAAEPAGLAGRSPEGAGP